MNITTEHVPVTVFYIQLCKRLAQCDFIFHCTQRTHHVLICSMQGTAGFPGFPGFKGSAGIPGRDGDEGPPGLPGPRGETGHKVQCSYSLSVQRIILTIIFLCCIDNVSMC